MPRNIIRSVRVYDVDAEQQRQDKILLDYLNGGDQYYRKVTNIRDAVPENLTATGLVMIAGAILTGAGLVYLLALVRGM